MPVTYLLDVTKEGLWKPKTVDSGTNEGLFFQFQDPTLIDRIEIKVKGGADNFDINYYLDGKRNISKNKPKDHYDNVSDNLAYAIVQQDSGNDRLFILGTGDYSFRSKNIKTLKALHVKITSIFIKINSASAKAAIISIRFFQDGNNGPLKVNVPVNIKGNIRHLQLLVLKQHIMFKIYLIPELILLGQLMVVKQKELGKTLIFS